jgi:hypothetical protein
MDDLAQYSPRRRPHRFVEPEPFRFRTPLHFRLAPVAQLTTARTAQPRRDPLRCRG